MRSILACIAVLCLIGTGCAKKAAQDVEAEVLVVEGRVLDGKMFGGFLAGPSGSIQQTVKMGVRFQFGGYEWLEDLTLKYAEAAHYADSNTLPLRVTVVYDWWRTHQRANHLEIRLSGRYIGASDSMTNELARKVYERVKGGDPDA